MDTCIDTLHARGAVLRQLIILLSIRGRQNRNNWKPAAISLWSPDIIAPLIRAINGLTVSHGQLWVGWGSIKDESRGFSHGYSPSQFPKSDRRIHCIAKNLLLSYIPFYNQLQGQPQIFSF